MALRKQKMKISWLLVSTILSSFCFSVEDAHSLGEECKGSFKQEGRTFCLDTTNTAPTNLISCALPTEVPHIISFILFPPIDSVSYCDEYSRFHYPNSYNGTCLQKQQPKLVKTLILPFIVAFNAKRKDAEQKQPNIDPDFLIKKGLLYSFMDLQYKCSEQKNTSTTGYMEICENRTGHAKAPFYLDFNEETYNASLLGHSVCSCVITSSQAITIRAIDVRLHGNVELTLGGQTGKSFTTRKGDFYWMQDGPLLDNVKEASIELRNIDPSHFPDSVWLQIDGGSFMISCGPKTPLEILQPDDISKGQTFGMIYIVVIVVGVVIFITVLCIAAFCVKQRCRKSDNEFGIIRDDTGSTKEESRALKDIPEAIYALPHQTKKESETELLESPTEYFELEHEYEEPGQASNNNLKAAPRSRRTDAKTMHTPQGRSMSNSSDADDRNVYNRLREKPDIVPSGHIYDTTDRSAYSSFRRQKPPPVIDNVYDK